MGSKLKNIFLNKWWKRVGAAVLTGTALTGIAVSVSVTPAYASDLKLHPPHLPWYHKPLYHTFDHNSIRRGYQVYKEVCKACHSLKYVRFRHLVGVCITEDEAKADAAEITVKDGPNELGEMFERPGKLNDTMPNPYLNEEIARLANNGAYPPDLSLIIQARKGYEDYVFHLLTGYAETPPAGVKLSEGMYYNPYFTGGALSMARALYNDMVEYPDGTPATASQMAKDVCTFLAYTADIKHDDRKLLMWQCVFILGIATAVAFYYKRLRWSYIRNMKYAYKTRNPPKNI